MRDCPATFWAACGPDLRRRGFAGGPGFPFPYCRGRFWALSRRAFKYWGIRRSAGAAVGQRPRSYSSTYMLSTCSAGSAWLPAANFKNSTFPEDATFREIPPRTSSSDSDELARGGISRKVAPSGKVDFSEPGGFSDVRVHVRAAERALGGARPGCSAASRSLPSTSAPLIGIYTDQWQGNAQQAPRGCRASEPRLPSPRSATPCFAATWPPLPPGPPGGK